MITACQNTHVCMPCILSKAVCFTSHAKHDMCAHWTYTICFTRGNKLSPSASFLSWSYTSAGGKKKKNVLPGSLKMFPPMSFLHEISFLFIVLSCR